MTPQTYHMRYHRVTSKFPYPYSECYQNSHTLMPVQVVINTIRDRRPVLDSVVVLRI